MLCSALPVGRSCQASPECAPFPPARFEKYPWYGGHKGSGNQNNYCFFEAAGLKFMVLGLEFAPTDEALRWAAGVLSKHPNHRTIVVTHCYMRPKGRDTRAAAGYGLAGRRHQDGGDHQAEQEPAGRADRPVFHHCGSPVFRKR